MLRIRSETFCTTIHATVVGAERFAVAKLAAAAGADLRTGGNFAGGVRRYGDERISARGLELCLEGGRDQSDTSPLRAGRRLQILMVVQELDVEQGDALRRFGWRVRRRADANGEGPEDEERGNPRCGERSATRREQSFEPGKAWAAAGLGRDSDAALASESFIVSSFSGGHFSHIAETSGCRACPVGWAIAV